MTVSERSVYEVVIEVLIFGKDAQETFAIDEGVEKIDDDTFQCTHLVVAKTNRPEDIIAVVRHWYSDFNPEFISVMKLGSGLVEPET